MADHFWRFLSIRWRIIFVASLVLVVTAGIFSWQQQISLTHQFEQDQSAYRDRAQDMAGRLFLLQANQMQVLGRMLADLPTVREAMLTRDKSRLEKAVGALWPELNLGQGLTAVALYDVAQQPLAAWGDIAHPGTLALHAGDAAVREAPMTWLECSASCAYQTVLPIVYGGRNIGSVAIVSSLENIILDLRRLSGAEVAVLTGPWHRGAQPLADMRVLSASGGEKVLELMEQALAGKWSGDYFRTERGGVIHHVMAFNLPVEGGKQAHLATITDVTHQVNAIESAAQRNLVWGAAVLGIAMLLLFALLRPAMGRIRQIALSLPLLGEEKYQEVREACDIGRPSWLRDEMDDLNQLSIELADRLEFLRAEARRHADSLSAQAAQLERERDFVSGLLDTAPVLIVTIAADGRVRLANAQTVMSCGQPASQIMGHLFSELFMEEWQRSSHEELMARMEEGAIFHEEGGIQRPDGQSRAIVWFYSCLAPEGQAQTYLAVGLDVTEHRLAERRLSLLSDHDGVTGLLNRRAFKHQLEDRLAAGEHGVLLVCDIDEFKLINEMGGHEVGDAVLQECANHIQSLVPPPQIVARLGGDDFALVFPGLAAADAIVMARALNQSFMHSMGRMEDLGSHHMSASIGVVAYPEHGQKADLLLANADIALTQARAKGHGSWHLYSSDDPYREVAGRRAYWRGEVEQALDEDRFVQHFQPILHIVSGRISHYEALLRLKSRDGALVAPGLFIDVAESTGLIRRIDRWVIDASVAFAATHPEIRVALNLSSRSFDDDVAYETMQAALDRHGVKGEQLLIEITETAALANFSSAIRVMGKLRGLGCAFGLDDFGVGYSSFQYLKELPVDFVKIDGSFIKGLTLNPDDVVFVKALNDAVKGYGKTTVAEFVEDEATLAILREIGVDYAQGYLIGRPAPETLT